MERKKNLIKL